MSGPRRHDALVQYVRAAAGVSADQSDSQSGKPRRPAGAGRDREASRRLPALLAEATGAGAQRRPCGAAEGGAGCLNGG